jgi:hypothetical protein
MVGLRITPLRGLSDLWFALSYNLYIPSGLKNGYIILLSIICKKINKCSIGMLNRNQENTPATYHFGLKTLFDGYLITAKLLCDAYVISSSTYQCKSLIFNDFFM